jgi:hypothetical protein
MKDAIFSTVNEYSRVAGEIKRMSLDGTGPPYVLDVGCPAGTHQVGRLTQDRGIIYQGIRAAYGAMLEAVTGKPGRILLRPARFGDL